MLACIHYIPRWIELCYHCSCLTFDKFAFPDPYVFRSIDAELSFGRESFAANVFHLNSGMRITEMDISRFARQKALPGRSYNRPTFVAAVDSEARAWRSFAIEENFLRTSQ